MVYLCALFSWLGLFMGILNLISIQYQFNWSIFLDFFQNKIINNIINSVSIELVDTRIEPVFIPENTRTLRNGKTFKTKPEIFTKYNLKTFDHFSKYFSNCLKLDIIKEKLVNFNIWLKNNIFYFYKSFAENFSNFNLVLKNLNMYKSDKKT